MKKKYIDLQHLVKIMNHDKRALAADIILTLKDYYFNEIEPSEDDTRRIARKLQIVIDEKCDYDEILAMTLDDIRKTQLENNRMLKSLSTIMSWDKE